MLIEQTIDKLIQMKMPALAASLKQRLSRPDHADIPFSDFIGYLVDDEWTSRQNRKLSSRLEKAKFKDRSACAEDLDFSLERELKKSIVLELQQNHWVESHQNILITGPSGSGKSYLAQALGNHLCRSGYTVAYYRISTLMDHVAESRAEGTYSHFIKKLSKTRVLIMDDLGITKHTEVHRTELLEILEDRYAKGSTIITSQLAPEDWHYHLGGGIIADAICDRVLHNAHRFPLKSVDSLRKVKSSLNKQVPHNPTTTPKQ